MCHSWYCIKTTKPMFKTFFDHLVRSPIIEAFGTPCADTKFKGNPFIGGSIYIYIYIGGRKNWRFSTEMAVYLGNGAR